MVNVRRSVPADLPGLMRVERESFPTPWSEESVLSFQNDPEHRLCYTATDDREAEVIGYLALQYVDDEAELCNIAKGRWDRRTADRYRRRFLLPQIHPSSSSGGPGE